MPPPVTGPAESRYEQAKLIKATALAAGAAAGLVVQFGAANTLFFYARSAQLEVSWAADQVAGVPASDLERSRAALREQDLRWTGTAPYAAYSGAAFRDPFADLAEEASGAEDRARAAARARAEAALEQLRDVSGPNDRAYYDGLVLLGRARNPGDYGRLAARWEAQVRRQQALRERLAASAGGLRDGLPADVVQALDRLQSLESAAGQAGISADPASEARAEGQLYLGSASAALVEGHAEIMARLSAAITTMEKRVNARQTALADLARIDGLLPRALRYGIGDGYATQVGDLKSAFAQARGDDEVATVADRAEALLDELDAAGRGRLPVKGIDCILGAPQKLIVIHLQTQQLVAYENGCPVLRTPVTTGRPALRTERGTFHIFLKARSWHMVSQWPPGSPFYYPPTWVYDAMEFIGDGTFIHNANWEPDTAYGPGSENGPYSSHGCVHVLDGPLAQLYDWAAIGTTVSVGD
jgi:lipoprotein-anchoring transpeptidase ErfK/SrfK